MCVFNINAFCVCFVDAHWLHVSMSLTRQDLVHGGSKKIKADNTDCDIKSKLNLF